MQFPVCYILISCFPKKIGHNHLSVCGTACEAGRKPGDVQRSCRSGAGGGLQEEEFRTQLPGLKGSLGP